MSDRTDTASRLIHASAPEIYQAFSTPGAMERWLPPTGMTGRMLAFDFREGGSYRIRLTYVSTSDAHGKTSEDADEVDVTFTALTPDRCIEQSVAFRSDVPDFAGVMKIIWEFLPVASGTIVSVRCEDVPNGIRAEDHEAGLRSTLENLAVFVESGA